MTPGVACRRVAPSRGRPSQAGPPSDLGRQDPSPRSPSHCPDERGGPLSRPGDRAATHVRPRSPLTTRYLPLAGAPPATSSAFLALATSPCDASLALARCCEGKRVSGRQLRRGGMAVATLGASRGRVVTSRGRPEPDRPAALSRRPAMPRSLLRRPNDRGWLLRCPGHRTATDEDAVDAVAEAVVPSRTRMAEAEVPPRTRTRWQRPPSCRGRV